MKNLKLQSLKREFPFLSQLNKTGFNKVELERLFEFYNDLDNKIQIEKLDVNNFTNPHYFTPRGFENGINSEHCNHNIYTVSAFFI